MDAWTVENGTLRVGIDLTSDGKIEVGDPAGMCDRISLPGQRQTVVRSMNPKLLAVESDPGVCAGIGGLGALVLFRNSGPIPSVVSDRDGTVWSPRGATLKPADGTIVAGGYCGRRMDGEHLAVLRPGAMLLVGRPGQATLRLCVDERGVPSLDREGSPRTSILTIPLGPARCSGPYPGRWCPGSMVAPSAGDAHEAAWVFFPRDPAYADGAWRCPRCVASLAQVAPLATEAAKAFAALCGAEPWGVRMGSHPQRAPSATAATPRVGIPRHVVDTLARRDAWLKANNLNAGNRRRPSADFWARVGVDVGESGSVDLGLATDHCDTWCRDNVPVVYLAQPYMDRGEDGSVSPEKLDELVRPWARVANELGLKFRASTEDSYHFPGRTILLALWLPDEAPSLTSSNDPKRFLQNMGDLP